MCYAYTAYRAVILKRAFPCFRLCLCLFVCVVIFWDGRRAGAVGISSVFLYLNAFFSEEEGAGIFLVFFEIFGANTVGKTKRVIRAAMALKAL